MLAVQLIYLICNKNRLLFKINYQNKPTQYIVLALLAFVWGSSFLFIKRGLDHFTSLQVAAIRMFVAFITLAPVAIKHLKAISRTNIVYLAISGIVGSGIPSYLFATAQTKIDSSIAGMINAFVPSFTIIIGALFFRVKIVWLQIVGIIIGFLGVFGLLWFNSTQTTDFNLPYASLVILATICYGLNVNIINQFLKGLTGLQVSSIAFFFLGPISLAFILGSNVTEAITADSLGSLTYLIVLGIFGTALALVAFNDLLRYSSPMFAASVTYLIPIVAVIWGVIDGESITIWDILSMCLILTGVTLINSQKKNKPAVK